MTTADERRAPCRPVGCVLPHTHGCRNRQPTGLVTIGLALTLLLALVLRLLIWRGPLHQLANDEIEYVAVARDLLAGRGWVFYNAYPWLRAPLYPLFLAGSLWLAGGDLHRAALPNIALSIGNVALAYTLALRLVGRRAALLPSLLTAVLWTNVTFASLYMNETLFTFLFLAGLVCLLARRPTTDHRPPNQIHSVLLSPCHLVTLSPCHLVFLSGVFLGLAALTRSAVLLFLPVIAVWLLLQPGASFRLRVVPAALFLAAALLTIAPWTVRNYVAYGRVIPVETGLAYNLWAFNEPRESLTAISRALSQIPNPAVRSDYATAQGLSRLREDPAILLRKLWPNWIYLTRVKPIEDRFVLESYYLDVHLPQFVAALVLDDTLYLLIALTGIAGLCFAPHTQHAARSTQHASHRIASPKALCVLWLCYIVTTTLLTHGEARYRHFLLPILIPYAAWALLWPIRPEDRKTGRPEDRNTGRLETLHLATLSPGHLVTVSLIILLLAAFLPTYPYQWAAKNTARGWYQALGDIAWATGNRSAALDGYARAARANPTADAYLRLGDIRRAAGEDSEAEAAYRKSRAIEQVWVAPAASLGDLLRARGQLDTARRQFKGSYADKNLMLDWTWQHLNPAPVATLDVGNGLDFGYLSGFYPAEQQQNATARWTNGRGLVRLGGPEAGVVRLRLAAPHPGGGVRTNVCVGSFCQPFDVGPTWRVYTLIMPPNPTHAPIEIRSSTFDGGNGRTLGVLVDTVTITPTQPPAEARSQKQVSLRGR